MASKDEENVGVMESPSQAEGTAGEGRAATGWIVGVGSLISVGVLGPDCRLGQ